MGGRGTAAVRNTASESLVYKATKSDEVSSKLESASHLTFSASTITMKDENDKTRGMVRNMSRASNMTGSSLFSLNSEFSKASGGVRLTQLGDYGLSMSNVYTQGKQIYVFNPTKHDTFLSGSLSKSQREVLKDEIDKSRRKSEFLRKLENNGVIVVNYK